ncbi:MAG: hypothetical protein U0527_06675 [Candidatus Eisenbacteria bacterium]
MNDAARVAPVGLYVDAAMYADEGSVMVVHPRDPGEGVGNGRAACIGNAREGAGARRRDR